MKPSSKNLSDQFEDEIQNNYQRILASDCRIVDIAVGQGFSDAKELYQICASAAPADDGKIRYVGVVKDAYGNPLANLKCEVFALEQKIVGETNSYGCFLFFVPVGCGKFTFGFQQATD